MELYKPFPVKVDIEFKPFEIDLPRLFTFPVDELLINSSDFFDHEDFGHEDVVGIEKRSVSEEDSLVLDEWLVKVDKTPAHPHTLLFFKIFDTFF